MANKMVKKGRVLLEDSMEIRNDLKKRYDVREHQIADITERDGNVLVQSGLNRLQEANDGEYNAWIENDSQISQMLNRDKIKDDSKASYIRYDKFIQNYSNNDEIMSLINLIKVKYNELTQNKSIGMKDFDDKLQEIYDTELDLLCVIAEIKIQQMNPIDAKKIRDQIMLVKTFRINKNPKFIVELNNLSEILCK
jgi:hypothetical protein